MMMKALMIRFLLLTLLLWKSRSCSCILSSAFAAAETRITRNEFWVQRKRPLLTRRRTNHHQQFYAKQQHQDLFGLHHNLQINKKKLLFVPYYLPSSSLSSLLLLRLRGGANENNHVTEGEEQVETKKKKKLQISINWNDEDGLVPEQAIIILDGFCPYHSQYLAHRAIQIPRVAVISICSDYLANIIIQNDEHEAGVDKDDHESQIPRMPHTTAEAQQWKEQLNQHIKSLLPLEQGHNQQHRQRKDIRIRAVYCESDSGLDDAEKLRDLLQVDCQDSPVVFEGRRNKHLMHQQVVSSRVDGHVSTPKQKLCTSIEEAIEFTQNELNLKTTDDGNNNGTTTARVVVKPMRGVASESVYLCGTVDEVKKAFSDITSTSVFGSPVQQHHTSVLVQEYIEGVEYAIDVVSCDGKHKVAAIWRYDKRPITNAGSFCYYQTKLVDTETDPNCLPICDAVVSTLDALGIKWGVSHSEFIVRNNSDAINTTPVLIEVNCRQHNMDFCPLVMACIGYNAFDMFLDAIFGGCGIGEEDQDDEGIREWDDMYPNVPVLRAHGCMVHLVNYRSGILKQIHHTNDVMNLPSVLDMEIYESFRIPGNTIEPTRDIRTDAGWVQLINPDANELQHDYETIVDYMPTMFEVLE